uniref:Uncharacterized protein n=1 Tax=Kalanchoe fedtschenkoi TaxID=63787 RepID=A0A7N0UZ99_KALFE
MDPTIKIEGERPFIHRNMLRLLRSSFRDHPFCLLVLISSFCPQQNTASFLICLYIKIRLAFKKRHVSFQHYLRLAPIEQSNRIFFR